MNSATLKATSRHFTSVAVFCTAWLGVNPAGAQDACTALINHGIYDFGRNFNSTATSTTIQTSICSAYTYLNSHGGTSSGGFNILDFGGASASISDSALISIGSSMCDNRVINQGGQALSQSYSQVIDQGIVNAYDQCLELANNGLVATTTYDEVYGSRLGISLRYTPPPGVATTTIHVTGIQIDSSLDPDPSHQVTCSGPLWNSGHVGAFTLGSSFVGMDCERPVVADPKNAFLIAGKPKLAAPVTVTVFTDAGDVVRTLAELPAPTPVASTQPAIVYNIGSQSIPVNQHAILNFSQREVDTTGGAVTVGPNWGFRAPTTGIYHITVSTVTNEVVSGTYELQLLRTPLAGTNLTLPKSSVPGAFLMGYDISIDTYLKHLGTSALVELRAGDTVQVLYGSGNAGGTVTFYVGRIGISYIGPCTMSPDGGSCQ